MKRIFTILGLTGLLFCGTAVPDTKAQCDPDTLPPQFGVSQAPGTINFDDVPGGAVDMMFIGDQYEADFGVRFRLEDPGTPLQGTVLPRLAKRGLPRTAFNGYLRLPDEPNADDLPLVGEFFLTDDI